MATKRPELKAEKRTIVGRKVKGLRKQGILPLGLYGKGEKSLNLQADYKEVVAVFEKAGETGLVELLVKGEEKPRLVLMKNPQFHPVEGTLLHLDLHQVKLTEKVTVMVPIELVGQSPAVEKGEAVLTQVLNEIEIEALPTDLPEKFIADVSKLEKAGEALLVSDLKIEKEKFAVKAGEDQVVVKADLPKEEKEEAAPVAEADAPVEGEAVSGESEAKAESSQEQPTEEKSE